MLGTMGHPPRGSRVYGPFQWADKRPGPLAPESGMSRSGNTYGLIHYELSHTQFSILRVRILRGRVRVVEWSGSMQNATDHIRSSFVCWSTCLLVSLTNYSLIQQGK